MLLRSSTSHATIKLVVLMNAIVVLYRFSWVVASNLHKRMETVALLSEDANLAHTWTEGKVSKNLGAADPTVQANRAVHPDSTPLSNLPSEKRDSAQYFKDRGSPHYTDGYESKHLNDLPGYVRHSRFRFFHWLGRKWRRTMTSLHWFFQRLRHRKGFDYNSPAIPEELELRRTFGGASEALSQMDPALINPTLVDVAGKISESSFEPEKYLVDPAVLRADSVNLAPTQRPAYVHGKVTTLTFDHLLNSHLLFSDLRNLDQHRGRELRGLEATLKSLTVGDPAFSSRALTSTTRNLIRNQQYQNRKTRALVEAKAQGRGYLVDILEACGPAGLVIPAEADTEGLNRVAAEWGVTPIEARVITKYYPSIREAISRLLNEADVVANHKEYRQPQVLQRFTTPGNSAHEHLNRIHHQLLFDLRADEIRLPKIMHHIRTSKLVRDLKAYRFVGTEVEAGLLPFVEPFGVARGLDYVPSQHLEMYYPGMVPNLDTIQHLNLISRQLTIPLREYLHWAIRARCFKRGYLGTFNERGQAAILKGLATHFPQHYRGYEAEMERINRLLEHP